MAHVTHKTDGIVLGGVGVGEAHRYVTLFTRELGLVRVMVRSARLSRSKLRYHVQDGTVGVFSLVRGRDVWRLTGAQASHNIFFNNKDNSEATAFIGRYFRLLRRLIQGEEKHEELFSLSMDGFTFLQEHPLSGKEISNLEYLLVLRMLLSLGYVGEAQALKSILAPSPITHDMLTAVDPLRRTMALEINRALHESQL